MTRPLFKYHGGKYYLKDWIISKFPKDYDRLKYIEPCFGAGSVFLNKIPSRFEIVNDINPNVYAVLNQLKRSSAQFINALRQIEYCEREFEIYKNWQYDSIVDDMIDIAITEMVRRRFSRGGLGKTFAWSDRERGGQPGDVNAWGTFLYGDLIDIAARFTDDVIVLNNHVVNLIQTPSINTEDAFWYIDPPYLESTRTVFDCYDYEMSEAEHYQLLCELKNNMKGKVLISGYNCNLYNDMLSVWHKYEKEIANHSSQSKTKERRIECLWTNYENTN